MASYHTSFSYLGKNSWDEGYIIAAFEADNGEKDTFLGMDQIYADTSNGTRRHLYGTKYNNVATITITLVKGNGYNFSVQEIRSALRWLTGSHNATWLDLYEGDKIKYSFLVTETNVSQYKLDARTVGLTIEFTSISPWAYSAEQHFEATFDQNDAGNGLYVDENHTLHRGRGVEELSVNENGTLYAGPAPANPESKENAFIFVSEGVVYIDNSALIYIDNQTDDLYTCINLDTKITNTDCDFLSIKNRTLGEGEETVLMDMAKNEVVTLSSEQFILSDNPKKLFGSTFNFVWPKVGPGENIMSINGSGKAKVEFTYRYPIKIGDCTMDIFTDNGTICDCSPDYDFGVVDWKDIANTPDTIKGYGIKDAYTKPQVDEKIGNINIDEDKLTDILSNAFS